MDKNIVNILHDENCSCVIANSQGVFRYYQKGILDLYELYTDHPDRLAGASIADKVVGKGAAALMITGGIKALYTDVISRPALQLLESAHIEVEYGRCVPNIINRKGTGICPVESLCADCTDATECLPLISQFVKTLPKTTVAK